MNVGKKNIGIIALLVFICVATHLMSENFVTRYNLENVLERTAILAIPAIGVAFVIITGGIDLSIGSVVCLVGCLTPYLHTECGYSWPVTLAMMAAACLTIGLWHGLLITKCRIQPFIVTLCGFLAYRGIARGILADTEQGFGSGGGMMRDVINHKVALPGINFALPTTFLIMAFVGAIAAFFLNRTIYGRYLLALGRNETATRLSGVRTDRMVIAAYVISSMAAGLCGLLSILDVNTAAPTDFGNFFELYAIAGAVLGGCSLRGGSGSIFGAIIGIAIIQTLRNTINLVDWIPTNIELAVIGSVILGGALVDETIRRLPKK